MMKEIRGDGVHDDGPGIEAALRGEDVSSIPPGTVHKGQHLILGPGVYRHIAPIRIGAGSHLQGPATLRVPGFNMGKGIANPPSKITDITMDMARAHRPGRVREVRL